jgi:hypothetical protein
MHATPPDPQYVAAPLELRPFRAHLLAPAQVSDPATARLFARPYSAVPQRLRTWQRRGLLRVDRGEHLYLHEYSSEGRTIRGLVAALEIGTTTSSPTDAALLPHEGVDEIQAGQLAERVQQMRLSPAPILLTATLPDRTRSCLDEVRQRRPAWDFLDHDRRRHRIWRLSRGDTRTVRGDLRSVQALVADGHHRLAAHQQLRRDGHDASALVMVIDEGATPLDVRPFHRLLEGIGLADLREAATSLGLQADGGTELEFTNGQARWSWHVDAPADEVGGLLHGRLLAALPTPPRRITYDPDWEALSALASRRRIAVRLPAISLRDIWATARTGTLLPEKATSFGPKPPASLFLMRLPSAPSEH